MKKINLQRGISLIETIVYVGIFSLLVIGLAQFSTTLTAARLRAQAVLEVNDQGSQAMRLITQILRNASSVNTPTIGNSENSLSIDTGILTTNPTIFSESNGALYVTEGSGLPVALTNNKVVISNLTFSNFSRVNTPNIIKVSFIITSVSARDPYSEIFNGSGALRK